MTPADPRVEGAGSRAGGADSGGGDAEPAAGPPGPAAGPSGAAPDDPEAKWTAFSRAIVLVLVVSILAVGVCVIALTTVRMGGLAREEVARKAALRACFLARIAFVPVSLENRPMMEQAVDPFGDDPDLIRVELLDARGNVLYSRQDREFPRAGRFVEGSCPITPRSPGQAGEPAGPPVGKARISFGLTRVYDTVERSVLWIAAACALLLAVAALVDLALISRMTARLHDLVGEARTAEKLRHSNQELEQFAFVASHDLQEPLRKVVSYCQLFQRRYKGKFDAEGEDFLRIIVSAATRMSALIQDLLALARVGTQGKPLQAVDCGAVLHEVLAGLQENIRESGATVATEPLPTAMADPGQLSQLLQNLIANALKFHGDKPPVVRLGARREGAWWRFCVADNGIGIDPKYHDRVFEMFRRLHSRDSYPGTGIGLAICKKIVERHGGRLWIESTPGEGASFYFTLAAPKDR